VKFSLTGIRSLEIVLILVVVVVLDRACARKEADFPATVLGES